MFNQLCLHSLETLKNLCPSLFRENCYLNNARVTSSVLCASCKSRQDVLQVPHAEAAGLSTLL